MKSDTIKVLFIDGPPYLKDKSLDVPISCLKDMKVCAYFQKYAYKAIFNINFINNIYTANFSHELDFYK